MASLIRWFTNHADFWVIPSDCAISCEEMPFLELATSQIAGSQTSKLSGESSKRVPTLTENWRSAVLALPDAPGLEKRVLQAAAARAQWLVARPPELDHGSQRHTWVREVAHRFKARRTVIAEAPAFLPPPRNSCFSWSLCLPILPAPTLYLPPPAIFAIRPHHGLQPRRPLHSSE